MNYLVISWVKKSIKKQFYPTQSTYQHFINKFTNIFLTKTK